MLNVMILKRCCGFGAAVERTPHVPEVMGSTPKWEQAFCFENES